MQTTSILHTYQFIVITCIIYIHALFPGAMHAKEAFLNLNIQDGLAHTDANCVAQDSTGLIWIGTNAGLQYYDGYQLQTINYYPPHQKIYKSHNRINAMGCSKSRMWIGSDSGLTCLDLNTHLYIPFTLIAHDPAIFNQRISQLIIDSTNQRLWVRTEKTLFAVQIEETTNTLRTIEWENDYNKQQGWSHKNIVIHQGDVWITMGEEIAQLTVEDAKIRLKNKYALKEIATPITTLCATNDFLYLRSHQGCFRFAFSDKELDISSFSFIDFHQTNPEIPNDTYGAFTVGRDETLWCSYFGGIFEVKHPFTPNKTINQYLENNPNINLSQIRINSLFIDKYQNLWIPTMSKGLYCHPLSSTPFHYLSNSKFRTSGFSVNEISSVAVHGSEALWMIIEGGSLFYYDMKKEKLELISLPNSIGAANGLQTLTLSANQQKLYIGAYEGLIVYDIKNKKSKWLIGKQSKILPVPTSISKIKEDRWGRIWVCSFGSGVYCIKDIDSTPSIAYHLYDKSQHSIIANLLTDLYIEDNSITLGTTHGLSKIWFDEQGTIQNTSIYQANDSIPHSMSSNYIACIDQQNDSTYWIGTIGGGVNQIIIRSPHNNDYTATCYTENNGLTNNDSEIVYLDDNQNVWIGGKGIARLNIETNRIYVYNLKNISQNSSFKIGAGCKADDGTIYMGSTDGLCYFQPKKLESSFPTTPISLVFNNLYINNQQVISQTAYDGQITLPQTLNQTNQVTLTYKQNNFTISFAALGYNSSNQIMYRYRMTNYDKKWHIIPHTENKVFYSNLPYDDYVFELQVSTDRGVTWITPGRTVSFTILPPWWLTNSAKIIYLLVLISITIIIIHQYHKEQILIRENHIKELERINEEEKYQSKMRFFMNVSHELKTPLTLIMLSAEQIMETAKTNCVSVIWNNSKKMLSLISELIDIRKADLGINKLILTHQNIAILVNQLFSEIKPWAEKKEIKITYISEVTELKMDFDWDKIGKLIINLLSNAVKYTPQGGTIKVILKKARLKDIEPTYLIRHQEGEIKTNEPVCILIVQDTGVGISPESIRYIYERFFQVNSTTQAHLGTGIGLAIAKTMALLHEGSIIVSSERTVGTEFIVALPIFSNPGISAEQQGLSAFDAKEFINNQYSEYNLSEDDEVNGNDDYSDSTNLPVLLIVEDNKEMQTTLKERLQGNYQVHIADNGKEGLEICRKLFPDIIISDVMMPEMDGVEMCKQIRNDLSIAYIPIILLTAKGNVENQIEGYESGADLYIPKPFSIKLLKVNIKRLLDLKERLLKEELKITRRNIGDKKGVKKDSKESWEQQLDQIIKDNISNADLSIDFLCEKTFISRSGLYHKMKEYNLQSLPDYIRNIRLTRAAELLQDPSYSINEVVMEVGLINTSHFSKIFKTKYGMSPSEYKNKFSQNYISN